MPSLRGLRSITTAVERQKKAAKRRGKPLNQAAVSKLRKELTATVNRQEAKKKKRK